MEQQNFNLEYQEHSAQLADLEERYKVLKDKVLLIGKNLIEFKDLTQKEMDELKIKTEELSEEMKKIKNVVLRLTEELEKFARKNELEILAKQMKMFQPLEFIKK